jgi:hypothetical protein
MNDKTGNGEELGAALAFLGLFPIVVMLIGLFISAVVAGCIA